jgi:hypothetical protein
MKRLSDEVTRCAKPITRAEGEWRIRGGVTIVNRSKSNYTATDREATAEATTATMVAAQPMNLARYLVDAQLAVLGDEHLSEQRRVHVHLRSEWNNSV